MAASRAYVSVAVWCVIQVSPTSDGVELEFRNSFPSSSSSPDCFVLITIFCCLSAEMVSFHYAVGSNYLKMC